MEVLPVSNIPQVSHYSSKVYQSYRLPDGSTQHRINTYEVTLYDHTGTVKTQRSNYTTEWIV